MKETGRRYGKRCSGRRIAYAVLTLLISSFFFLSCGSKDGKFHLKGTFKGFNQGELYIYGFDGSHKMDTIAVARGEFRYQTALEDSVTFVLVFPNFTEIPLFGTPNATVEIDGDASHLKETKITGTKENEQMTAFRLQTSQDTPPAFVKSAAQFIRENPASPFCPYLLNRYFVQGQKPDYRQAAELADAILKAKPDDKRMETLKKQLKGLSGMKDNAKLPAFTAVDIDGNTVKSSDLNAKLNVISVWATWNYDSQNMQRQLIMQKLRRKDDLKIVSICLDATVKECRKFLGRDTIKWNTICDGKMWESSVVQQLGLYYVPDNIITDSKGTILAHSLPPRDLYKKIDELLPQ